MGKLLTLAALLMSGGVALAAPGAPDVGPSAPQAPPVRPGEDRIQLAQRCGFYAILGCFGSRGEANNWNSRIQAGYVVNTSSAEYPNFRAGYFCVVNGPTSYGQAQGIANSWRSVVPSAYVKNAC